MCNLLLRVKSHLLQWIIVMIKLEPISSITFTVTCNCKLSKAYHHNKHRQQFQKKQEQSWICYDSWKSIISTIWVILTHLLNFIRPKSHIWIHNSCFCGMVYTLSKNSEWCALEGLFWFMSNIGDSALKKKIIQKQNDGRLFLHPSILFLKNIVLVGHKKQYFKYCL